LLEFETPLPEVENPLPDDPDATDVDLTLRLRRVFEVKVGVGEVFGLCGNVK
jgi:hypothetical protein